MSSTINTTEGSSVAPEETACATSFRTKKLYSALDKTLNTLEQQLQQKLTRNLVKPLRRKMKKSESTPFSKVIDEIVQEWRGETQSQITEIVNDNEIPLCLYKLDELIAKEKKRNPDCASRTAWRPTGHPATDVDPVLIIRRLEHRDRLKEGVEQMEKELADTIRKVEAGRGEVMAADKEISVLGKQLRQELKLIKNKVDEQGRSIMSNEELTEMTDQIKKRTGKSPNGEAIKGK